MTVPCLRPQDLSFDYETAIVLENRDGTEDRYDCKVQFIVASDDAVYVTQVDVLYGGPFGHWQDCRRVEYPDIAASLLDKARDMADLLFDTFAVEIEDRRAEQQKADWLNARDMADDNADARGHALRERIAERAR